MTEITHRLEKKPFRLAGLEPATGIESYGDVPWYRRQELIMFPLFVPAMIVVALTGDVFHKANKKMRATSDAPVWRYTAASRVFFAVVGLVVVATVLSLLV